MIPRFTPYPGFDPLDGHDPRVSLSASNPVRPCTFDLTDSRSSSRSDRSRMGREIINTGHGEEL